MSIARDIWDHLPFHGWIYLGVAVALLLGKTWYDHDQQVIGETRCETEQLKKQAVIADLQAKLDAEIVKANSALHAQYDALKPVDTYDPISLGTDCKLPADVLRAINKAHARH